MEESLFLRLGLGRVLTESGSRPTGGGWWVVTSAYDASGRRSGVSYPDPQNPGSAFLSLGFTHDVLGRLESITQGTAAVAAQANSESGPSEKMISDLHEWCKKEKEKSPEKGGEYFRFQFLNSQLSQTLGVCKVSEFKIYFFLTIDGSCKRKEFGPAESGN